ncbi:Glycosyl hydrolase family 16 [Pleurostoma richardsiae]|uniref:Crh-like protein n=1 Tax=Pleurostoma richardsiae TaxID=41990 RepID=A0AA38VNK8_9PEZI|nr:Glycosyl hydrolase family 16 [Pleurostoma richardsiae]
MAMSFVHKAAAVALLLASSAAAQTYTSCNPTTNSSCPSDTGLSSSTYSVDFTQGADDDAWTVTAGSVSYTSSGAEFTISEKGDAPTIETSWYFFFGRAEVHMRAATGTGIVSSVVLESDDLDEVDWEWLGGYPDEVQTDYFGKGNTTSYDRGGTTNVTDTQSTTHNYTIDWTSEAIVWYVDGTAVRTLNYDDALDGKNYPQTPMRLILGIWAGGDSDNAEGTITWAGGETDYDDGPFTMTVESVSIYNANPASSYTYGDETGDWTSIKIDSSDDTDSSSSTSDSASASSASSATTTTTSSGNSTTGSDGTSAAASSTGTSVASVSASGYVKEPSLGVSLVGMASVALMVLAYV